MALGPALAAVSASSFPRWPLWPGMWEKVTWKGSVCKKLYTKWIVLFREQMGFARALMVAWLSR